MWDHAEIRRKAGGFAEFFRHFRASRANFRQIFSFFRQIFSSGDGRRQTIEPDKKMKKIDEKN